jgi:hypothetical protein
VSKNNLWKSKLYIWTVCECVRDRDRERGRKERGGEKIIFYFTGSLRITVFERGGEDIYK